jgi:hypothetical protein
VTDEHQELSTQNDKLNRRMPLISAEAGAVAAAAWLASAVAIAYLFDWIGLTIAPFVTLLIASAAAAAVWYRLHRRSQPDGAALAALAAIVGVAFVWLMWRARPDFLPTGSGSDLAHHLALLSYIEAHGRLAHDAASGAFLGEMIDYTPGAHLLAVIAARVIRTDALHVVHAVVALTVALKAGIVFLIARRLMPSSVPRIPFAIVAVSLLWLPYVFFVGSFMEQSFLSQVVAELFAVTLWWVVVEWNERPSSEAMALFALFGVATFLTWPIWIGPPILTLTATVIMHAALDWRQRLRFLTAALAPILIVAAIYTSSRLVYGLDMVHAVGFAIWPSPRTLGWTFIVAGALGFLRSMLTREPRSIALMLLAIGLQGAALIVTGLNSGATAPYLTLKMSYLAIYPMAVGGATVLASVTQSLRPFGRYSWLPVILVVLVAGRAIAFAPAVHPVVTQPVFLAGSWARTQLPADCIDYLVADGYTAYWLHLAVFGNPRAAGRSLDDATFDPKKALVRWILPGGLRYAIADDFDRLPRDIRSNVDVLARFGPAAVVQRRGASVCEAR